MEYSRRDPTRNDNRETCFACSCGRAFLALPALNPLQPSTFWDGDHVVSSCPDCGAGLQGMLYHGPSARHPNEAHTVGRTDESTSTSGCRAGAACAAGPGSSPPQGLAGEGSNLPASREKGHGLLTPDGSEGTVEWTFTRRRDGRIVMEEGK